MVEPRRVGIRIPNPFLRWPVEQLVRSLGVQQVLAHGSHEVGTLNCQVLLADAEVLSDEEIRRLVGSGCAVVVFAAPERQDRLTAARRAGAVALPRLSFLQRLPDILAVALSARENGR